MDNMMLKTKTTKGHVSDLKRVMYIIQHYRMHLNPKKCIFVVTS